MLYYSIFIHIDKCVAILSALRRVLMKEFEIKKFGENVVVRNFTDEKFKTMRISVNMILPLEYETVAQYAVLPSIVSRATMQYPDITSLSKHLAELYGCSIYSNVGKIGDNQILNISAGGISDKFVLEKENLAKELSKLLCSAIFSPVVDDDCMIPLEAFKQEQRQAIENIDANFNDKRVYAKKRCTEIMFENEAAGISRFGTKEQVQSLKREELIKTWLKVVQNARFEIFVLGDCNFDTVCKTFSRYFDLQMFNMELSNKIKLSAQEIKYGEEEQKLSQSKLVLGFRTGVIPEDALATRVMCVMFGGSVSSKLFTVVREKMSLCYYCSSRLNELKGAMFVESGVETENIEKAKTAILEQLNEICEGKFTNEELEYAKLAMLNSYNSIMDSLYAVESFYISQIFANKIYSPEEIIKELMEVDRIQIIEAARKVTLDTVFTLRGIKENGT